MSGMVPTSSDQVEPVEGVKQHIDVGTPAEPVLMEQPQENPKTSYQEEEEALKKKYGGILPKKVPLISKDHERAFFDSADWALGKQGGAPKPKGPLKALQPKLQPTPQQRSRRSAYSLSDGEDCGSPGLEDTNDNE